MCEIRKADRALGRSRLLPLARKPRRLVDIIIIISSSSSSSISSSSSRSRSSGSSSSSSSRSRSSILARGPARAGNPDVAPNPEAHNNKEHNPIIYAIINNSQTQT